MIYKYVKRFIDCYNLTNHFFNSLKYSITLDYTTINVIKYKNHLIHLRNNKIDEQVFYAAFTKKYHIPPLKLPDNCTIIDLGSNIGMTILDFYDVYPNPNIIIGLEMDNENYNLAVKNLKNVSNVVLLNKAISINDSLIYYSGNDPQSYSICQQNNENTKSCDGVSMLSLIKSFGLTKIDYLKIDIEGYEYQLICHKDFHLWSQNIDVISIEMHDHLSIEKYAKEIVTKLEINNFLVRNHPTHFNGIIAINKKML